MATQRQIAANRLNGLLGGVKTEAGKAVSRLNARKHGIYASLLIGDEPDEHRAILDALTEELQPVGPVEEMLVDKLAATYLRMQRCAAAEKAQCLYRRERSMGRLKYTIGEDERALGQHEQRLTNQFLRVLREVERRQERRIADCGVQISECRLNEEQKTKNEPNPRSESETSLSQVAAATVVESAVPALDEGSAGPAQPRSFAAVRDAIPKVNEGGMESSPEPCFRPLQG